MDDAIQNVIADLSRSNAWGQYEGPYTERLRNSLSQMHSGAEVRLCSSGTSAVELALRGVGVKPDDEVIMSAYDFKANFVNIQQAGAVPVLAEVTAENWHPDVNTIAEAMTSRTKAVLVSHLHGGVCPMPELRALADQHNVVIIEDVCQMPGAIIAKRRAGEWGDVAVFSFGGSKTLSAGRGGAVISHSAAIMQRIRLFADRGNDLSPLSELQAAVLLPQLESLGERETRRRDAVKTLTSAGLFESVLYPLRNSTEATPGYYKLGMKFVAEPNFPLTRSQLLSAIQAEGIAMYPGFRSLHCITSRRRFQTASDLGEASRADAGMIVLHHPVLLGTDDELRTLVEAVRQVIEYAADIAQSIES